MTNQTAADELTRQEALNPAQSFIVQAPAGSGKTELLMQRYLALLATVDEPEEIIAITFTRKATGEMRNRILSALQRAASKAAPDQPHERRSWQLAKNALIRDQARHWNLQQNPNRLRIQTIDALCASLARQMPVLSGMGVSPETTTDASDLYQQAARATLAGLPHSDAVGLLLAHLDNNWQKLEAMIISLLAKRDHWLRHLPATADEQQLDQERGVLEASFRAIINETLNLVSSRIDQAQKTEWLSLARFAGANLRLEEKADRLAGCADQQQWPSADAQNLPVWLGLIDLVLTRGDDWRKTVDKKTGFPAVSSTNDQAQKQQFEQMKARLLALIESLQDRSDLLEQLRAIRILPSPSYTESQWQVLKALFEVLKLAVAQLRVAFSERGQVDFIEISMAASHALGESDAPTDLALALDYRIRHLLVDEFQDTSVSQYSLLEKLSAGWQDGDGRSLFLVGDPMQSIYRFREAEVGLFINVQETRRLGQVAVKPLSLEVNFRSQPAIVDWVNTTFRRAMPEIVSATRGAVSYTPSIAFNASDPSASVRITPLIDSDPGVEARQVCELADQALQRDQTVAVLVRSRTHLLKIMEQFRDKAVPFQAVEIEALAQRPVIRDLHALTCALLHLADRVAWLAILRAPWCGLTLADLALLAGQSDRTIYDLINDNDQTDRLSEDGQIRCQRIRPILQKAVQERRRLPLARWVEGVWLALGGPACLINPADPDNARSYFELLNSLDEGAELPAFETLDQALGKLFATPQPATTAAVQVMTIHKAKGLEFDTVIIPALDRQSRNDERQLLQWTEWRNAEAGDDELLLAPIEETGADREPINLYLSALDKDRARHETVRLLYVAATRARTHLHLIGTLKSDAQGELKRPDPRSLLAMIWPSVQADFRPSDSRSEVPESQQTEETGFTPYIRRLKRDWQCPPRSDPVSWFDQSPASEEAAEQPPLEYNWAGAPARHVGIVVHRLLQQIADDWALGRSASWDQRYLQGLKPLIESLLQESGLSASALPQAVTRVETAIMRTLQDQRGRWILSADHQQARNEYALTGYHDGKLVDIMIDRTFVDEAGTRWIIDYKTGSHEGGNLQGFLDTEQQRYRPQLERYAAFMQKLEDRVIRIGLYFPLHTAWREWQPEK